MRYIKKISFLLFLSTIFFVACKEDNDTYIKGLSIDKTEIIVGEDGGSEKINILSESEWTAICDQPWVMITPANGIGSSECRIYIDSSLINDVRTADIKISSDNGERKNIKISQTGYGKIISLDTNEVNVDYFKTYEKRYFEVSVTTNVLFDIIIPNEEESWITYDKSILDKDAPTIARPRTFKMRFNWEMNTEPSERKTSIEFVAKDGSIEKEAVINIIQQGAPLIENNRAGDSICLLMIQQKLNCYSEFDAAESMSNWDNIGIWERTDKDVTPEMIGRVKSIHIQLYDTDEDLPSEIGKLTYLQSFSILGNINGYIKDLRIGDCFNELKYIKNITLFGHGLTSIEEEFANIKQLENLDLGANNFTSIPTVFNKNNFPSLKSLNLSSNRRANSNDLSSMNLANIGLYLNIEKNEQDKQSIINLLSWDSLEQLALSFNFIEGKIPDMEDYPIRYTAEEVNANDTLPEMLIGMPKILPNAYWFSINLNMLTGKIPDWILYHPYLWCWDPYTLVFNQEGFNSDGKKSGFENEPVSLEYYYKAYPLRRPVLND